MKQSIRDELQGHIEALVEDDVLHLDNTDDWHHHAFSEDYYVIGYHNCKMWLAGHGVSPFEAIETVKGWEQFNTGEVYTDFSSPEAVVNMYVYILGEEVLSDIQAEIEAELEELQS